MATQYVLKSGTLTRPANTTAYGAGDALSTETAASTSMTISDAVQTNGGAGRITRVRLVKDDTNVTNADFTVHLFNQSDGVGVTDDNSAFTAVNYTSRAAYIADVDLATMTALTDGAQTPWLTVDIPFVCGDSKKDLFILFEVDSAYTPTSGNVFTLYLDIIQYT